MENVISSESELFHSSSVPQASLFIQILDNPPQDVSCTNLWCKIRRLSVCGLDVYKETLYIWVGD